MCSVVGYVGKNRSSEFILDGLSRLEYRGYDSAGFACIDKQKQKIFFLKSSGQLSQLAQKMSSFSTDGSVGIGHTRWSTHGNFSEINAHPHLDCSKTIAVVHNGIIENYQQLRAELHNTGHIFISSTDTETIPHLFESIYQQHSNLKATIIAMVQKLYGMYAFIIMVRDQPDLLIAVRKRSPLCIGCGQKEIFIASDSLAFTNKVDSLFYLPDESFAFVYHDKLEVYDFSGNYLPHVFVPFKCHKDNADKGDYEHFMLKEIEEQPQAITNTIQALASKESSLWVRLGISQEQCATLKEIVLIGCGTSWHAASIARFFFEQIANLPVQVLLASECRYSSFFPNNKALYIFVSQSGETADTLEALRFINSYGLMTVALTNVGTSTIVREAQGFLLTMAGTEVSVASTKAFTTQLAALYWLAHSIANRHLLTAVNSESINKNVIAAGQQLLQHIELYKTIIVSVIAPEYSIYDRAVFLGKHTSYFFALEAALKLKEIGYVFAQAYPSGELKHGPLALIDETVPVYIFSHPDTIIYQKILVSAHAVRLRGGKIIAFAYQGQSELCDLAEHYFIISLEVPFLLGSLVMSGLMQFLMYSIAKERGCPIDKPRNLAKSVTVE